MSYPVTIAVQIPNTPRNRLTTLFRLILAIPHAILVGGLGMGVAYGGNNRNTAGSEGGLLGAVAVFLAIVNWFAIVITGASVSGCNQFIRFYLRWRVRALSYMMLLEDQYPPFGDAPYPASIEITEPTGARDRVTVALRLFLGIPHFIILPFVLIGWGITTVIAWFSIVFTGEYPKAFYNFGVGALRWRLRVEAYMLLLVDDYPPFSLE